MSPEERHPQHTLPAANYQGYKEGLLAGDQQVCLDIVGKLIDQKVPEKSIYFDLVENSFCEVGELWEANAISVDVLILAAAITENAMHVLRSILLDNEHCGYKAVVCCINNDPHQIGGKMVADMFKFNGWNGFFLESRTPVEDISTYVEEKKPELVCFSLTLSSNYPILTDYINTLTKDYPLEQVVVGGQAFRRVDSDIRSTFPQVKLMTSLEELERFINDFEQKNNHEP